jgi:anti-sigma factor RsiW
MKCEDIREQLLDLAGAEPQGETKQHLASCPACAKQLGELRQTMSLLDEWKAPEPSAYFDSRLRARLRAEAEQPRGFFAWLKAPGLMRPVAAAALTLVIAVGVGFFNRSNGTAPDKGVIAQNQAVKAPEGSAVSDLQTLDKNEDVLANFELLDEVASNNPPQVHQ